MRTTFAMLVAALSVIAMTTAVAAHHSFSVDYDVDKPIGGTGVVTKVEWTNPHMRVYIDVKDDKGVVTTWNLELGSPNSVVRRGWTKEDLKAGQTVTFKGYGGRVVVTRAAADMITLPDGRAFSGASGAPDSPGR